MDKDFVRAILRLATKNDDDIEWETSVIESLPEKAWTSLMETLTIHRLVPIAFHVISLFNLEETVPERVLQYMSDAKRLSGITQAVNHLWMDRILAAMAQEDIIPVVWKGMALANLFYSSPSERPFGDIDLLIERKEWAKVNEILSSFGFRRLTQRDAEPKTGDLTQILHEKDGFNFIKSPENILLDVHHRCRLFENVDTISHLTVDENPLHLNANSIRVFEPTAMLVHLVVHLDDHSRNNTGYYLSWLLDIALFMKHQRKNIDPARLDALLPTRRSKFAMIKILGFLMHELDIELPDQIEKAVQTIQPVSFEEILRSRRVKMWGLPYFRGWARIVLNKLGFQLSNQYPELRKRELRFWVLDRTKNYLTSLKSLPQIVG